MSQVAKLAGLAGALLVSASIDAPAQQTSPTARDGTHAFAVEALGGTIGSAVGIAVGLGLTKPDDCPTDDIACILQKRSVSGVIGVAGATLGTTLAGRWASTEPSIAGAFLGAAAGLGIAIGLEHLLSEEMDRSLGDAGVVLLFSLAQGILAAAGSRLIASLRRN
jgi:hypothetical protein